jgi:hypothetical protein
MPISSQKLLSAIISCNGIVHVSITGSLKVALCLIERHTLNIPMAANEAAVQCNRVLQRKPEIQQR